MSPSAKSGTTAVSESPPTSKFEGWLGKSPDAAHGKMEWGPYEARPWTEDDVDIEISHCGICATDIHVLRSGWHKTPYPVVVGHEIVGRAIRVGKNVKHIRPGDRVGVGYQGGSCMRPECRECSSGEYSYCAKLIETFAHELPDGQGKTHGGYADFNRSRGDFVVRIPDGIESRHAAPLLCGGITMYAPLRRFGCGPGKSIGIVGVGGLGHTGLLFARAMGADRVVAISRKSDKREDVLKLGADDIIATGEEEDWQEKNKRTLDLVIVTAASQKMPLDGYAKLLKVFGTLVQVGAPDGNFLPPIDVFTLILNCVSISGSLVGSPSLIAEMLQFASDKKVKPWVEEREMSKANEAIVDMEENLARYRYVLVNEHYGKHE